MLRVSYNNAWWEYAKNFQRSWKEKKTLRDAIRIARKCKTLEEVDETIQTLKRYESMQ